jgi:hypothetical protein
MTDIRLKFVDAETGASLLCGPGQEVETSVSDELCERLRGRGVGLFSSEANVIGAVREELAAVIRGFSARVR